MVGWVASLVVIADGAASTELSSLFCELCFICAFDMYVLLMCCAKVEILRSGIRRTQALLPKQSLTHLPITPAILRKIKQVNQGLKSSGVARI